MRRSPKSGRELHSAVGYKGPKWLVDVTHRLFGIESGQQVNYTAALCFHEEDGVGQYWQEYDGEEGLELVLEAMDALEEEKEGYRPVETWRDEGGLYWAEQVEEHARELIDHYFQQTYGYLPDGTEISRIEQQVLSYRVEH